ncbi:hypothetical protein FJW08_14315 [Mesorhizobium sp. B3-2-1]|nr:hypothetical protein FJW08_14315 [Mesorhizobium sp. B3-2-1]
MPRATLPISPLVGEMPGRAEGGAKDRGADSLGTTRNQRRSKSRFTERSAGQRPPLACRPSPPRGGRSGNHTNPRLTIIASGEGILPRNAV